MTARDYAAEMRAFIDAEIGDGPYQARAKAEEIVEKLRATNAKLLSGWLDAQAEDIIWRTIQQRDCSLRSRARATAKPRAFATTAGEVEESGDTARLVPWLSVPFTTADGFRRRLKDMTKDDCLHVAASYKARAAENRLTAAFLTAIARKVGRRKVGDVYSDQQLSDMWASLGGDDE